MHSEYEPNTSDAARAAEARIDAVSRALALYRGVSYGTGGPVTLTQNGNHVAISATVNIWGCGADIIVPGSTHTFRQAAINGIINKWSGYKDGLNVSIAIMDLNNCEPGRLHRTGHGQLNIQIINASETSTWHTLSGASGWRVNSPGWITLHTGMIDTAGYGVNHSVRTFHSTSGHEFGHALGVGDGVGFGYAWNTTYGNIRSIMTMRDQPATRLDLEFALRAHNYNRYQRWSRNHALIETYGIRR